MHKVVLLLTLGVLLPGCSGADKRTASRPFASTRSTVQKSHNLGDRIVLPHGDSVRAIAFSRKATPSNSFSKAGQGLVFTTLDAEGCAGNQPPDTGVVNPFFFKVVAANNADTQSSLPVKEPSLGVGPKDPFTCIRGFVTFELPAKAEVMAVDYQARGTTVRWAIP